MKLKLKLKEKSFLNHLIKKDMVEIFGKGFIMESFCRLSCETVDFLGEEVILDNISKVDNGLAGFIEGKFYEIPFWAIEDVLEKDNISISTLDLVKIHACIKCFINRMGEDTPYSILPKEAVRILNQYLSENTILAIDWNSLITKEISACDVKLKIKSEFTEINYKDALIIVKAFGKTNDEDVREAHKTKLKDIDIEVSCEEMYENYVVLDNILFEEK